MLPKHGPINCRLCFSDDSDTLIQGPWRLKNNPLAAGAQNPRILVLGFSKGRNQNLKASIGKKFNDIPFQGMRDSLSKILQKIGALSCNEHVDNKIHASENDFAFGSLVRCSIDCNGKTSGDLLTKIFGKNGFFPVKKCFDEFLSIYPERLQLIVMLGSSNGYIRGCRKLFSEKCKVEMFNDVSYFIGDILVVHVTHPSGANGHKKAWLEGKNDSSQGLKREQAIDAICSSTRLSDLALRTERFYRLCSLLSKLQESSLGDVSEFSYDSWSYSGSLHEFESLAYQTGFMLGDFNWISWQDEALYLVDNPYAIADCDIFSLRKLTTAIVRAERMCSGALRDAFKKGSITAINQRLCTLSEVL